VDGFPRAARLLVAAEFNRVFERRPVQRGRFFTLHSRPPRTPDEANGQAEAPQDVARIGIVVPKKLLKTAVHRNLVKRIVRESFRKRARQLAAMDIVVRLSAKVRRGEEPIDRQALALDVLALLDRLPQKSAVS
jgi:ribonuclease P protein component